MLRISFRADFYMTYEDQVFVTNVVVINLTREIVTSNVISQPTNAATKLNAIAKICKYKRLHKEHHFISMAMEVHGAPECDMGCFIREHARLFHDKQSKSHSSLLFCIQFFCIQFFKQRVNISFQRALASTIKRRVRLASDAYSRPLTIIRSHDLHANNIKRAMNEIASYHERD